MRDCMIEGVTLHLYSGAAIDIEARRIIGIEPLEGGARSRVIAANDRGNWRNYYVATETPAQVRELQRQALAEGGDE